VLGDGHGRANDLADVGATPVRETGRRAQGAADRLQPGACLGGGAGRHEPCVLHGAAAAAGAQHQDIALDQLAGQIGDVLPRVMLAHRRAAHDRRHTLDLAADDGIDQRLYRAAQGIDHALGGEPGDGGLLEGGMLTAPRCPKASIP
jgi:hypothetical protein